MKFKLWLEQINLNSIEVIIPKGTKLYHGTLESFDTRNIKTAGYDEVFWTSDDINIARMYIPETHGYKNFTIDSFFRGNDIEGIKKSIGLTQAIINKAWEKQEEGYKLLRFWDDKHQWFSQKFKEYQKQDVYNDIPEEFFTKWMEAENNKTKYQKEWKTSDYYLKKFILQKMKNFGYDGGNYGYFKKVKTDKDGNLLPADYKDVGKVLEITCTRDFKFYNIGHGKEGDLMDLEYKQIGLFRKAEEKGYDGIVINDFAQSEKYGNYGHKSFGFFNRALKDLSIKQIRDQTHP